MNTDVLVWILVVAAVAIEFLCGIGILLLENALDRLHLVGLASIVGPFCVAAAAWIAHGADQTSLKATLVLVLLVLTSPVLGHVTARAIVQRSARQ